MLNKKLARLTRIIKASCAFIPMAALPLSAPSLAAQKVDKRWFEVEVILFSQLGDKTQLNENFSGEASLPRYRQVIDLLTPYLQPDTSALKLQLPSCETREYAPSWQASVNLPELHQAKSLAEIEQFTQIDTLDLQQGSASLMPETQASTAQLSNTDEQLSEYKETADVTVQSAQDGEFLIEPEVVEAIPLTEQELALVAAAEQTFATPELAFAYQQVSTSQDTLCQPIATNQASTISDYHALSEFNNNNAPIPIPIENFTGRVDGNEFVYSNSPYLIDADSLKLKDISLQLRRSKNFKPLLHLGWRQPLTNRKKPSLEPAIRIFAGEHYREQYRQAQADHQSQLSAKAIAEYKREILGEEYLTGQTDISDALTSDSAKNPEQAERLANIYQQLDTQNFSLESVLAELNKPHITAVGIDRNRADTAEAKALAAPAPPNQDWLLDGLFRLHLNHYLHITADFNVAVPYSGEEKAEKYQDASEVSQNAFTFKLIPFSQNKRVISKEVHYFDHPYMGMVLQIRRYKPPLPETRLETE
ncbi:hypothetical protein DXX93_13525 [Thalassotalea euphylliae]|uniref:Uncharacterized protein n=1 Tax=Thalassotalea euphylliae TaxID=1655234 RepID=A0A3E0TSG0_9GAMM|nr:CsiV family protein [Thalassotalea euphylliae]REL27478.1 hypothetical protein DXX93_13525 [Thalassotalea euphylliae]